MSAPSRGRARWLGRTIAVAAAGGLLLAACTSPDAPEENGAAASSPPSPPVRSSPPSPATSPAGDETEEVIEFEYTEPESPCPPVAELETLPLAETYPYALVDPFFDEWNGRMLEICTYERAENADNVGPEEDTILEEHALITSQIKLHCCADPSAAGYPTLPLHSDDLHAWGRGGGGMSGRDAGVWWEGCGPATPCADGEEPTIQTHAWKASFRGHVGNLEFDVNVAYIARTLPRDVESKTIEIFRDLVLAAVDSRDRVG